MSEKELDNVNIGAERLTDHNSKAKRINTNKCKYCDEIIGYGAKGMCNKHYMKYKRHGDPFFNDNKERGTIEG